MKKIAYIITATLLVAGLGWAYYAYGSHLPVYSRSVAESVLVDQTQQFAVMPTWTDIIQPIDLDNHKWESVQVRVGKFSEFKYTESCTVALPGHFFLLSNPDERDGEIHHFERKADSVITAINGQHKGYSKSSIYAPFIEEANRVAATKADVKIICAYTDCCENTPVFSIYKEADRNLLIKHPEKVMALLSQYGSPGNLQGLTIHILYKPETERDNEYFTLASGLFKKIFDRAGAKVEIGANLITNNQ